MIDERQVLYLLDLVLLAEGLDDDQIRSIVRRMRTALDNTRQATPPDPLAHEGDEG